MKYTDFNGGKAPKLFLGQLLNSTSNAHDIQWQKRVGDSVIDEGVARTIRISLDEIDVEADGAANNVMLSSNNKYLVKTGFVPDTTGLGSKK